MRMRTDNGTEYIYNEFKSILIENKIKHEKSAPYISWQNGGSERQWQVLFDVTRGLLLEANLPKCLWAYAIKCSAYIRNRCIKNKLKLTPYEAFTDKRPNVSNMNKIEYVCIIML